MSNLEASAAEKDYQLADIQLSISKATKRVDQLATPITTSVLRTPHDTDGDVIMGEVSPPNVAERMLSFSGKSTEVRRFIRRCEHHFLRHINFYGNDEAMKVNFIEDCLEGDAALWFDVEQADLQESNPNRKFLYEALVKRFINPIFHISELEPYHPTPHNLLHNHPNSKEIIKIRNSRKRGHFYEYLVTFADSSQHWINADIIDKDEYYSNILADFQRQAHQQSVNSVPF